MRCSLDIWYQAADLDTQRLLSYTHNQFYHFVMSSLWRVATDLRCVPMLTPMTIPNLMQLLMLSLARPRFSFSDSIFLCTNGRQ